MKKKNKIVYLRIEEQMHKDIVAISETLSLSYTEVMRLTLAEKIAKYKGKGII